MDISKLLLVLDIEPLKVDPVVDSTRFSSTPNTGECGCRRTKLIVTAMLSPILEDSESDIPNLNNDFVTGESQSPLSFIEPMQSPLSFSTPTPSSETGKSIILKSQE